MRNVIVSGLVLAALALVGCGSTAVPDRAETGDSCDGALQPYTCSFDDTTVLSCNGSTLWDVAEICDSGSCTLATEGEGEDATFTGACCDRDGVLSCYPQAEG